MKRFKHNLTHYHNTTMFMGELIPISCVEVLPGDTFRHRSTVMMRFAPMVAPPMHPVNVQVHHWFVPNRLVWDKWEEFITKKDPTLTVPKVTTNDTHKVMLEYMGVPPEAQTAGTKVNALPVRAYNMIYNEFYRDQDIHAERAEEDLTIARGCWQRDYFTTARQNAQQGSEVQIPFSSAQAPVHGIGMVNKTFGSGAAVHETGGNDYTYISGKYIGNTTGNSNTQLMIEEDPTNPGYPGIYADLSGATGGIAISDFRKAVALARMADARNRFGDRYVDYLRYLRVNPRDGRLGRPEYLGGGRQTVAFSEVLATANGENNVVGDMAGHGIASLRSRAYRRFFEEHGHVITMLVVRPKTIYMNSLHRNWLRNEPDDYWQKELQIMQTQPILKKEVYAAHGNESDVFGYTDKYREYFEHPSRVSQTFRTTDKHWHFARDFLQTPELNASFLDCVPPGDPFANTLAPQLYVMAQQQISAKRLVRKAYR